LPQPTQARLQRNSGSSISTSGITLPAKHLLLDQIAADTDFLEERYWPLQVFFLDLVEKWISPPSVQAGSPEFDIFSRPGSTDTVTGPIRLRASITVVDQTSGPEAPAVIPTALGVLQPIRVLSSLPSAIR